MKKTTMKTLWRTFGIIVFFAFITQLVKIMVVGATIDDDGELWLSVIAFILYVLSVLWFVRIFIYLAERQMEREEPLKEEEHEDI